ncbi:hypothetical protein JDV02_002537 [Purpureocillium takamizusanense]|uniref:Deoxyribonuclease NucA/NucB domain-containing protein n=1 Tax=Purpureocillium takamizusanense TaxID=2060973 RepID=A0A9Q8QB72_9HYPO|nr:uncharacterized protein JDV02_002537 [Purpureocillium takamizusanense]UNI16062.1 hypothetical protein JDV02_002537 [Purpureocillium takamizusanense]
MSYKTVLFAAAAWLATTPQVTATPPDVTFLCNRMPEVCTNMCWAVRCGSPTFSQTLNWDSPNDDTAKKRRLSAGCQKGNKCNKGRKGPGHRGGKFTSCDEYPFASTSDSKFPNGHQVSRCVPPVENSRQGKALQTVYGRWRKKGLKSHSLQIAFGNPGSRGVKYCGNQKCKNDGFQVQDKSIKKRDEEPLFKFYKTGSGMVLGSLTKIDTPSNFTREVDDQEQVAPHFEAWKEDVEGEDVHVISDTVLEEMPFEEAMKHFEGDA